MRTPPLSPDRSRLNVTELLLAWGNGDRSALDDLVPLVHQELRRLARLQMRGERDNHTLQTTALVNEAFLRMIDVGGFTGTCPDGFPTRRSVRDSVSSTMDSARRCPCRIPQRVRATKRSGHKALELLNATPAYRRLFAEVFPEVEQGAAIDFFMFGKALAEFEFTLVFADAPLDQFARDNPSAMTANQKRGAMLFFGRAACVRCHAVAGPSNEMFSDFAEHAIGVPQIAPAFGAGTGNVLFAGDGRDEDFGREEVTGNPADRYKFRTAPLRNLAVAPGFFHNGAFTRLDDAIRFHLNVVEGARTYDPVVAGVPPDLAQHVGPVLPVRRLDPEIRQPAPLSPGELDDLVAFVRDGLHDAHVSASSLCQLVPAAVPSGRPVLEFERCR
jgi:mono/diheme cytochrome c family protein